MSEENLIVPNPETEKRKEIREEIKNIPPPKLKEVMELLEIAIDYEGSANAVARVIGYSKSAVCLVRKGKYDGNANVFYAKLKREYDFLINGIIMCPGIKGEMHPKVCKQYKEAAKAGKMLKGAAFLQVKDMCRYCPIGGRR
ncbi:MAG: hypothetical protein LBG21_03295 [Campylobacteraceae bacterium]|jgi:hypothetical protein|nr:hypothetical protein [Campylobacteraceae bacterium]